MAQTRLTVLGTSGAFVEPGRACSGYLLEYDDHRLVLDLGYGTATTLLRLLGDPGARGLDGVLITHAHADHCLDLHALFRARWFGARREPPLPVIAPAAVRALMIAIERNEGEDGTDLDQVFAWCTWTEPASSAAEQVGPWQLERFALPHYLPNAGLRLTSPEGLVVAYTGDTGPTPALTDLGREADLLIAECTDYTQLATPKKSQLHLNARSAGQATTAAGAKRLLLTHFWPGVDRARTAAEVAGHFDGEIIVATEGLVIEL